MKRGNIFIGTSGWHYKHWKGTFYPEAIRDRQQFDFYKQHFQTVEINNSFYRLPSPETFTAWRENSPDDFLFVVKANRFITHMKKLTDPEESIKKFFSNVVYLKEKLGPILFQLPPSFKVNVERFESFLDALPRKFRYVFEFRDSTWYTEEIFKLLIQYNCAFCIYELARNYSPTKVTADFVYVRLHGPGAGKYEGSYSDEQLRDWADQCRGWQQDGLDVYVYFDNDQHGYAAFNAKTLKDILRERFNNP